MVDLIYYFFLLIIISFRKRDKIHVLAMKLSCEFILPFVAFLVWVYRVHTVHMSSGNEKIFARAQILVVARGVLLQWLLECGSQQGQKYLGIFVEQSESGIVGLTAWNTLVNKQFCELQELNCRQFLKAASHVCRIFWPVTKMPVVSQLRGKERSVIFPLL